jgi:hypothetical protein
LEVNQEKFRHTPVLHVPPVPLLHPLIFLLAIRKLKRIVKKRSRIQRKRRRKKRLLNKYRMFKFLMTMQFSSNFFRRSNHFFNRSNRQFLVMKKTYSQRVSNSKSSMETQSTLMLGWMPLNAPQSLKDTEAQLLTT